MSSAKQGTPDHSLGEVLEKRFERRSLLGGIAKVVPLAAMAANIKPAQAATHTTPKAAAAVAPEAAKDFRLQFTPVGPWREDAINVADGYGVGLVIKWGDGLFNDSPEFDPERQSAAAQAKQFGYNNDWMGYFPLPAHDVENPRSALLAVNH